MSRERFNQEELDALEEALHALSTAETHFRLRDKANAQLHLAAPKYSPITKLMTRAARQLSILLDGDQISLVNEDSESSESEPPAVPVDRK